MQFLGQPERAGIMRSPACQGHEMGWIYSIGENQCGFLSLFCIFQGMLMVPSGVSKATLI